jgi:hypothetical protein
MQEVRFYERGQAQAHSMIRTLAEEMVLDRRPVHLNNQRVQIVALAARIAETILRMAAFAAVHESGYGSAPEGANHRWRKNPSPPGSPFAGSSVTRNAEIDPHPPRMT